MGVTLTRHGSMGTPPSAATSNEAAASAGGRPASALPPLDPPDPLEPPDPLLLVLPPLPLLVLPPEPVLAPDEPPELEPLDPAPPGLEGPPLVDASGSLLPLVGGDRSSLPQPATTTRTRSAAQP